jgi:lipoyl-dependent peroxiredoxin subunit D
MTSLDAIRDALPEYARDLKLNLSTVLTPAGAPGLSEAQVWAVALSSAIAARNVDFARSIEALAAPRLGEAGVNAARAAAAVMGMNNIYYRFLHLVENAEYQQLPARLRMNVIANPGIDRMDFELCSLAVSAINGCGKCVAAHERQLRQHGVSAEAVQSAARIAAVIHAVAGVLEYEADGRATGAAVTSAAAA